MKPTYNNNNAKGYNVERRKKSIRKYNKSDKRKKSQNKYNKKYYNQLCNYNGETLTLCALLLRFRRKGINNPTVEAKKYIKNNNPIEFYDIYP